MSFDLLLTSRDLASERCSSDAPPLRARIEAMPNGQVKAVWSEKIADDPRGGYWSSLIICADRAAALDWIGTQAAGREHAWDGEA